MGHKNFFEKKVSDAQSLGADFSTDPIDVGTRVDNVGINIETSGVTDNTGIFYIDHRVYKDANNASGWAELTLSSAPTLADGNDTFLINLNQLPKGQIRVRFVAAGGTPDGTVDIWVAGKEL